MNSNIQVGLHQLPRLTPKPKTLPPSVQSNSNFSSILKQTIAEPATLKISKHAEKRLAERGISIDAKMWEKISEKVQEAKTKGVHDSLVITEEAALVISAKNNTVITAMDRQEAKSQIFTNINGTIMI